MIKKLIHCGIFTVLCCTKINATNLGGVSPLPYNTGLTCPEEKSAESINGCNLGRFVNKVLIWHANITVNSSGKIKLPHAEECMSVAKYNILIGSVDEYFDAKLVEIVMKQSPIHSILFFRPANECYYVVKNTDGNIFEHKIHEYKKYKRTMHQFHTQKQIIAKKINIELTSENTIIIGNSMHARVSAQNEGIEFIISNYIADLPLLT